MFSTPKYGILVIPVTPTDHWHKINRQHDNTASINYIKIGSSYIKYLKCICIML